MAENETSVEERLAQHFLPDVSESEETEQPQSEEAEQPVEESATEEEAQPEFEEVEIEGETYQVPPKLKNAFLAQKDYTEKTTETARLRDTLNLQQKEIALFNESQKFESSVAEDVDRLKMLDSYIQYEKSNTDWSQLDTNEVVRKKLEIDQLAEQRDSLAKALTKAREEFNNKLSGEREKLKAEAEEALSKAIPNWNDETRAEVEKYAMDKGYPEAAVQNMSALDYQVAWEASQYRKLVQGKADAVNKAAKAPPVIKPGASNPMPQDVKDKLKFKKVLEKAKKDKIPEAQKAKLLQSRLEQKMRRIS